MQWARVGWWKICMTTWKLAWSDPSSEREVSSADNLLFYSLALHLFV